MLDKINPFTGKIDRKTEHSDAHQNVLRNNPDEQHRKKHDKRDHHEEQDDLAAVSIDSLYLFLQSALPKGTPQNHPAAQSPQETPTQNSRASQAASAYQQRAGEASQPPRQAAATGETTMSAGDINSIHNLMAELKGLQQKGISRLKIQEGEGFLDSLVRAIKRAKAGL